MDNFIEHDFSIIPHHGLNWFSFPQLTYATDDIIMDVLPLEETFFEFDDWAPQFSYHSDELCFNAFPELENISFNDFDLPPLEENFTVDAKPLSIVLPQNHVHCNSEGFTNYVGNASLKTIETMSETCIQQEEYYQIQEISSSSSSRSRSRRKMRPTSLSFDEIKKYFGVPITVAAREMNVGLTLLKRRCRELNIMRWPHRKLKSLKLLIDNVKEMGLPKEVDMLEQQQRMMMDKVPGMELTEKTKKLRQACFKANYKRRRSSALRA